MMCQQCGQQNMQSDDTRWLALLVRQGLKVIVVGIERRYGLRESTKEEAKGQRGQAA